ncbi:TetR/AcrR family transcriptional regulator [Microbacterium kunmingense]|uniref:TetR/AcrR family transcriptional regulator n=1 Tax=Microbacterium kunmingense TaxID=2915939 RepID=UPI003D7188C5
MQDSSPAPPPRVQVLADAAIRVISRDGLRALTHRAVDREAALPQGSTSYYASTRLAVLEMIAARLAERSLGDLHAYFSALANTTPAPTREERISQLAGLMADFVGALLARPDDMRARYALVMDYLAADPLSGVLSSESPLLADAYAEAPKLLRRFGIDASPQHGRDLMLLTDAVTFSRTVHAASPHLQLDVRGVLAAFLRSLPRLQD